MWWESSESFQGTEMRCFWTTNLMRSKQQLAHTSLYLQQKQRYGCPWEQALSSSLSEPHSWAEGEPCLCPLSQGTADLQNRTLGQGEMVKAEFPVLQVSPYSQVVSISCSLQSSYPCISWSQKKGCFIVGSDEAPSPAVVDPCIQQKGRNAAKEKWGGNLRARPALAAASWGLKGSGHPPGFNHPQVLLRLVSTRVLFPNSS